MCHPSFGEAWSGVLNRAWRGDDGCAPLVANDGRGAQDVFDDALELLADAAAALGLALPAEEPPRAPASIRTDVDPERSEGARRAAQTRARNATATAGARR